MRPFHHITIVFSACLAMLFIAWWTDDAPAWQMLVVTISYLVVLATGCIFIRWNFYLIAYHNGNKPDEIALSFDDGPGKETEAILDILKEQNTPATFFCIGKHAFAQPEILRRIDNEGHLIGNHSYHHGFNFDWQTASKMTYELRQTNQAISDAIGKTPKLFRPPYGITNPNLARAVKNTKMSAIGWSLRTFDTTADNTIELLDNIFRKLKGGDIILLHDTKTITREILTELISTAKEKGFTFVRIDRMLDLPPYE